MLSEEKISPFVCTAQHPAAAWSWKAWEMWDVQSHPCNPPCLPFFLLRPQASGQLWAPLGAQQGKGETSDPRSAPAAPLPLLCLTAGRAAGPAVTQVFPRNRGCREEGWKPWRLMLLHCREALKQSHKEALVPKDENIDQGCFPEQQRSNNMLLFHQLYSTLNDTRCCGMALQDVENHPLVMQSTSFLTGMRKGKTARIQVLWQPNTCMTRLLSTWNYLPQNYKLLC